MIDRNKRDIHHKLKYVIPNVILSTFIRFIFTYIATCIIAKALIKFSSKSLTILITNYSYFILIHFQLFLEIFVVK